ncbi:MAG: 30S ribosomal protein S17 [Pyrinomonadaceae bacterium]
MPRKKKDEVEEAVAETPETAVEETAVEAAAETSAPAEDAPADETAVKAEDAAAEPEEAVEAAPAVEEKPKKAAKAAPKAKAEKKDSAAASTGQQKVSKRAEKIGIVSSDKMTKTVTVRVDRTVKHPVYRKYVKKRKKFMAHDEMGAKIGDKVKIIETRPLSARKRWRVVEIIHRAER